jgi:hypothetical protein
MEPTPQELTNIVDLGSLLEWAGLDDTTPTQPASGQALISPRKSFLAWAGWGPTQHFRGLSMLQAADFQTQLAVWTCNGTKPNMGALAAAMLAQQVSRYICGADQWPSEAKVAAAALAQQTALQLAQPTPPPAPTTLVNTPIIKIGRVLDQKLGEEITYMPNHDLQKYYSRYVKVMDEKPSPDVAVTVEQLTAIKHMLDTGRLIYADFSVFCPNGQRMMKKTALSGATIDTHGHFHDIEMYGPSSVEEWGRSYDCLTTALIMLDAVSRPNLSNYRKLIFRMAAKYGSKVWHLLYQSDVRCRQEVMEATRMELFEEHNTALATGVHSNFDVSRPWDMVWQKVTKDGEWWTEEFKEPAMLVLNHIKNLKDLVVDDDAPIGYRPGSASTAPPSPHPAGRPVKKPTKNLNQGPSQDGMLKNRKGIYLCPGYQDGSCTDSKGTAQCQRDGNLRHQCANCLQPGHGSHFPKVCTLPKAQPKKVKGGGKGNKGGGKGNKGKNRW